MKITKDMLIGEILDMDVGTAQFFLEMGMHCLGCPASRGESIEAACQVHGTDCDQLRILRKQRHHQSRNTCRRKRHQRRNTE